MRELRYRKALLRSIAGLILLLLTPPVAAQTHTDPAATIEGVTQESHAGIEESVAAIMERERLQGFVPMTPRQPRPELHPPPKIGSDPSAPAVSRWPPAPAHATPQLVPQTVGVNFLAISGPGAESGFVPPDSMGDVGPTQLLIGANGRIKVFDKAGILGALNTTMDNFFASVGGLTNSTTDPHIRYDRLSGRWFVCIISANNAPNQVLLAVSSGPTITGTSSFTFFSFLGPAPPADFADYPTLGLDKFALYVGVNEFDTRPIDVFVRATAFVINKAKLLEPTPTLVVTAFRDIGTESSGGMVTPQGVSNDDPQATEGYLVGTDILFFGRLGIRRVTNPGGIPPIPPTISPQLNVTVPATTYPIPQIQPAPGATLDGLDDRLLAAQVHINQMTGMRTLWTAHAIEVNAAGVGDTAGNRNGSRWYEIGSLTTTPSLIQAGTLYDPAATTPFGFWMPSVAMSGQGHVAIGASRAGANISGGHASVAVAGRLRTDALGITLAQTLAQASTFSYDQFGPSPERWGDYSQTVVDPTDNQTMWTFQEYTATTNIWGVRATQLKALPPATPSTASTPVAVGQPSVNVTITGTSTAGSEFFDPGPDTGGPGFPNHLNATVSGVTVNSATFLGPTKVRLDLSTVGATPGVKTVAIINPDGQSSNADILRVGSCTQIDLNPASLPNAREGFAYSQTFTQTGAIEPATFTQSGVLPTGMTFNAGTATLSGTPAQNGTFPVNITVTDAAGCIRTRKYSLSVSLASGLAGAALSVDTGGNSILEVGDLATLVPAWRNNSGAPLTFGGYISNWTGPPGPVYTILDTMAFYGTIPNGATRSCSEPADCYSLIVTAAARPATHWDGSFLETLNPAIPGELGSKTWTLHVGNSFTDVPSSHLFYFFIETLLHHGVTGGCAADAYCPSSSVTREQMAVFVLRAKETAAYTPPPCTGVFSDVPNNFFCPWIEELFRRGITGGCSTNPPMYCPGASVTRSQMAVFVLRGLEGTAYLPPPYTGIFNDVPNDFFGPYIEEFARRGITVGCSANPPLYCPGDPVTRGQMAVFLSRAFGLKLYGP